MPRVPYALRLDARCPNERCRLACQNDVYPAMREVVMGLDPDTVLERVQCGNCSTRYLVTAAAFQNARKRAA